MFIGKKENPCFSMGWNILCARAGWHAVCIGKDKPVARPRGEIGRLAMRGDHKRDNAPPPVLLNRAELGPWWGQNP
jgi:hypothetical protein